MIYFINVADNFTLIFLFTMFIYLSSWFGIANADTFIESFFFLEITYLSLVLLTTLLSILTNFFLFDLLLIFILFFSICDSILGLILTLITFKINKSIKLKRYHHLNG